MDEPPSGVSTMARGLLFLRSEKNPKERISPMKAMPLVQKFMTPMPHTIEANSGLLQANERMTHNGIRHLPVMKDGRLVGVVSDRDVALAASHFAAGTKRTVEDVMIPKPYVVRPDASLDRVVGEMAEKKYGSVLIEQENGKVVGIFTAVDAMRVLHEVLREHYKGHD